MDAAAASVQAFGAFAKSASLAGVPISSGAIVDQSVEVFDSEGNARHCAAVVHFLKADLPTWTPGAALVVPEGNFKLRQTIADDGIVVKVEATPGG